MLPPCLSTHACARATPEIPKWKRAATRAVSSAVAILVLASFVVVQTPIGDIEITQEVRSACQRVTVKTKAFQLAGELRRRLIRFTDSDEEYDATDGASRHKLCLADEIRRFEAQNSGMWWWEHMEEVAQGSTACATPLHLQIKGAIGLSDADGLGLSDPYCKCSVEGTSIRSTTKFVDNTLTPKWDHTDILCDYQLGQELKCEIRDYDAFSGDDRLGVAVLTTEHLASGFFEGNIPLTGKGASGSLSIKAKVHGLTTTTTGSPTETEEEEPIAPIAPPKPFAWARTHKVRKDWHDLTNVERLLYLEAVNKLKATPREGAPNAKPGNNMYDAFVMIHGETDNKAYAHQTAGFLAWHRKYLLEYEEALRKLDPKFEDVTIPYWDWSAEMFECKNDKGVWLAQEGCETYHEASQLLRDFGGPGDGNSTQNTHGSSGSGPVGCVTTGPFKGWLDHNGKCLSRGVNWRILDQQPFTGRLRLAEIIQYKRFGSQADAGFRLILEGVPHGSTHNYLGGHMRSFISPADPIFFSHHAYIDKIWAAWQDCHDYDTKRAVALLTQKGNHKDTYHLHQPTRYGADAIDDAMVFNFAYGGTAADEAKCSKEIVECATCVHEQDSWCDTNPWDQTCKNICFDKACASVCGAPVPIIVNMHDKGTEILKHWNTTETTPLSMHSVHHLGDRSYSYAQDEFERHIEQTTPEALGNCTVDSHKAAQKEAGVLLEVGREHHAGTRRGAAANAYALMLRKAFERTNTNRSGKDTHVITMEKFKLSMRAAQDDECKALAMENGGDYKGEFNCKSDNPRFFIPWMGGQAWKDVMSKGNLKAEVFQSYCCRGDEKALEPRALLAFH